MTSGDRACVVGPAGPGVGAQLDDVRHWRLVATAEGRLLERRGPDDQRELCAPGQAARAVVAPAIGDPRSPRHGEVLGLLDDHGSVLAAVPVAHLADTTLTDDPTALRQRARLADLATRLGLTLERATPEEATAVRAARRTWLRPPHETRTRRLAWATAPTAILGTLAAIAATGDDGRAPGPGGHLATLVAVALLASATVLLHLVLRRTLRHDPAGADELPLSSAAATVAVSEGVSRPLPEVLSLEIGSREVVHRFGARTRRVPGPDVLGATSARIDLWRVRLLDEHEVSLLVLPSTPWLDADGTPTRLARTARAAGLRVDDRDTWEDEPPHTESMALIDSAQAQTYTLGLGPLLGIGVRGTPLLTIVGGTFLAVFGLGAPGYATDHDPASLASGLAGLAVLVSALVQAVRISRWTRRWPGDDSLHAVLAPGSPRSWT
ncbi:hypothetical protein K8Z61_17940 [Nocardioides sp. TRM66260-LWL]|uniref:hypothetical protein n=1 Tax=Nocardioides sp. TRM66260-LWL TaxID=2874478 RepID=UPI001CC71742|nr:hypothetical protein [Nocardioides sp. TRM66260-LWL]MBZ5736376.1 hypothetical protein [Nocardioides sp. TRM66260-LWL]